ncbi:hypothetical protein [Propionicicella superfundia]|uniref:hypothetical protein n=1 Tax=Propionicicella superfundia TaxID=348582 RepID=UPI0003F6B397|nr:hypothetical protein [Propionicicella superfundia]
MLAVLSGLSGHGSFSGGVAAMLAVYGLGLLAAGWGLWRLSIFSRGPVVAAALLHVAVIAGYYLAGPYLWVAIALSLVPIGTVVAAVWPSTTRALQARRAQARSHLETGPAAGSGDER